MLTSEDKPHDINASILSGTGVKFLCDQNLNRLCRWMRVLGFDVALESVDSVKKRAGKCITADLCADLFRRARNEKRIILTASKRMEALSLCPQSYLVPHSIVLEDVLVEICRHFSIELDPKRFLTVCGKCGKTQAYYISTHPPLNSTTKCHQFFFAHKNFFYNI